MAAIEGMSHPTMVEYNGILYVTGYRGGGQYLRKSADGGRTWLEFAGGSVERYVGPSDAARAGLIKMESQGRRLMAALARGSAVEVYLSEDDGETWALESVV